MAIRETLNLSDRDTKQRFINAIIPLKGRYRVEVVKAVKARSNNANAYMWACVITPFCNYLKEQGNTEFAADDAHEILKARFLSRTVVNHETGEVFSYTGSTAALNTTDFGEYLDKCIAFLESECNMIVQRPEQFQ